MTDHYRRPAYLSPSAVMLYLRDPDEYALRYLTDMARPESTPAMLAGGSFDYHVKSFMATRLGLPWVASLEETAIGEGTPTGLDIFNDYRASGGLVYLLEEILRSTRLSGTASVMMQTSLTNTPPGLDCPIMGKPDLYWTTDEGVSVIIDWKVNGYYSPAGVSPKSGYVHISSSSPSTSLRGRDTCLGRRHGIMCSNEFLNTGGRLEYAIQLTMYSWLLGIPASSLIIGIEQLTYRNKLLRVAHHRGIVDPLWESSLKDTVNQLWANLDNMVPADWSHLPPDQREFILRGCKTFY